jgi:hypothetical protein
MIGSHAVRYGSILCRNWGKVPGGKSARSCDDCVPKGRIPATAAFGLAPGKSRGPCQGFPERKDFRNRALAVVFP